MEQFTWVRPNKYYSLYSTNLNMSLSRSTKEAYTMVTTKPLVNIEGALLKMGD